MSKRVLLGTSNVSKGALLCDYLALAGATCVTPAALGVDPAIAEEGRTAAENARLKARAYHAASGLPVLAEDSGLLLLDLPDDDPDQPGLRVRRAAGHEMTDEEMIAWFAAVAARHGGALMACWLNAWCFIDARGRETVYSEDRDAARAFAFRLVSRPCPARLPGWPLDSLSIIPELEKYSAEMTQEDWAVVNERRSGTRAAMKERILAWLRLVTQDC